MFIYNPLPLFTHTADLSECAAVICSYAPMVPEDDISSYCVLGWDDSKAVLDLSNCC